MSRTRGHSLIIKGCAFEKEVNLWNSLPQKAVEAMSMYIFKLEIDRFLISYGE